MQEQPIPYGYCQCGCGRQTSLAPCSNAKTGWVRGQPVKYVVGHAMKGKRFVDGPDYVVDDETGCWVWVRLLSADGYGRHSSTKQAHRAYWERLRGPVPDGLQLDHLCRNPACVNPDHLEVVTQAENSRRGACAKLTWDIVAEIRASTASNRALGRKYNIDRSQISRIRSGQTWNP